jgi:4'-phosphopantetheinyl transferase
MGDAYRLDSGNTEESLKITYRETNEFDHLPIPTDKNCVDVWRILLDNPLVPVRTLWHIINPDDRCRAERFRFERDQMRYIASHGMLRVILGYYVGIDPAQLDFIRGIYGKPYLVDSQKGSVEFNISCSDGFALLSVTCDHQVGIDVERVKSVPESDHTLGVFFSENERAFVNEFPTDQKPGAFFALWTLKEAHMKAIGCGLSLPVNRVNGFSTGIGSFVGGENGRIGDAYSSWLYKILSPANGYIGAIVVEN